MFTRANLSHPLRRTSILELLALLLLCLSLNSGCDFKLYETDVETVQEEDADPEIEEARKAVLKRSSHKIDISEREGAKGRRVRRDLENFVDEDKEEGWDYIGRNIKLFATDDGAKDGLLIPEEKLPGYDKNIKSEPVFSFIHLSDAHHDDERVYMFGKKFTKFADLFKEGFAFKPGMVVYDHSYHLTLIQTINEMLEKIDKHNRNPNKEEKIEKPKFMIHTGDAVNMGVVSELYEFIYITNELNIPWFNVLGNHDAQVYGNLSSKEVGVIRPNMGFQTLSHRYNFINMHGKGFYVDGLVYFSPSNAPDSNTLDMDSVYNGFDMREGPRPHSARLEKLPDKITLPEYIDYDPIQQQLRVVENSAMTEGNYKDLLALSPELSYRTAIEELYEQSISKRGNEPCRDCPGYYYFEAKLPTDETPGILCIALDTTTNQFKFAKGTVYRDKELEVRPGDEKNLSEQDTKEKKLTQMKWLKGVLEEYRHKGNWMVLVFGHHQLNSKGFFDDSHKELSDVFLDPKNNVVAYFCGHTHEHKITYHENDNHPGAFGFWEIITDSIMEYPKKGSLVTIKHAGGGSWELVVQGFWPYFLETLDDNAPILLRNAKKCFDASKVDDKSKRLKTYQEIEQGQHDVVLKFVYPKTN